ncbi:spore wall protein 2-like [Haliotis rubra]|uniref:spore wall protein 2-like n=1 Tax=Haliotis rubra TaxID=36100 RepID=UPI001EE598F8|nr:spore wall protein 2-like [Haliotis rubra]
MGMEGETDWRERETGTGGQEREGKQGLGGQDMGEGGLPGVARPQGKTVKPGTVETGTRTDQALGNPGPWRQTRGRTRTQDRRHNEATQDRGDRPRRATQHNVDQGQGNNTQDRETDPGGKRNRETQETQETDEGGTGSRKPAQEQETTSGPERQTRRQDTGTGNHPGPSEWPVEHAPRTRPDGPRRQDRPWTVETDPGVARQQEKHTPRTTQVSGTTQDRGTQEQDWRDNPGERMEKENNGPRTVRHQDRGNPDRDRPGNKDRGDRPGGNSLPGLRPHTTQDRRQTQEGQPRTGGDRPRRPGSRNSHGNQDHETDQEGQAGPMWKPGHVRNGGLVAAGMNQETQDCGDRPEGQAHRKPRTVRPGRPVLGLSVVCPVCRYCLDTVTR